MIRAEGRSADDADRSCGCRHEDVIKRQQRQFPSYQPQRVVNRQRLCGPGRVCDSAEGMAPRHHVEITSQNYRPIQRAKFRYYPIKLLLLAFRKRPVQVKRNQPYRPRRRFHRHRGKAIAATDLPI